MYIKTRILLPLILIFLSPVSPNLRDLNLTLAPTKRQTQVSRAAFHDAMRKLWEDHITWTRVFVLSALADLPDKQATTDRLLANQVDIGNAIKPYYGDAAGEKLTSLLKTHITTAAELVSAAKAKDNAKVDDAKKRWYANADEIAVFLSTAIQRVGRLLR
jgi:hypothetical protein